MKILNFGSLNIDYVYEVEHLVRPGETISSLSLQTFAGGKGLNQSIALARAGAAVYHAGAVGEKDGQFLTDILKANHVNTDYIKVLQGEATGHAMITVDYSGQNSIVLYGGANQKIGSSQIEETLQGFNPGDYILLQNEISNLAAIIDAACSKGMKIILNPSPMNEGLKAIDLKKVTYLILNEIEAQDITGETDQDRMLESLLMKYPDLHIVLTLGAEGSIYKDHTQSFKQAAFQVKAVDTTAAGDTFTGYFFASLSKDKSIPEALLLATKASAISVTRKGAEASIPNILEVQEALKSR